MRPHKFSVEIAVVLVLSSPTWAAPSGKIGFIGLKGAGIWNLQSGKIQILPHSARADNLAFLPRGTAIFFVPPREKPNEMARANPHESFISRPPYRVSRPVAALSGSDIYSWLWNRGRETICLSGYQLSAAFSPATGALRRLNYHPESFDAKGNLAGYSTEENVVVRDIQTGRERVIFSTKNPKPIFDALRHAKNPKNVADLLDGEADIKEKQDYSSWQLAGPALSPDGKRAYFASNCGTGFGAAGNGMQGIFACDLTSGKISVLSKLGAIFGRPPEFTLSPDGARLLSVSSVHSSAADNSSVAFIIDLTTQNSREVLFSLPGSKAGANFYGGGAWSPNGKYVAISGYFYNADQAMKSNGNWDEPKDSAWQTAIINAKSGKIWGVKNGMRAPSWSR